MYRQTAHELGGSWTPSSYPGLHLHHRHTPSISVLPTTCKNTYTHRGPSGPVARSGLTPISSATHGPLCGSGILSFLTNSQSGSAWSWRPHRREYPMEADHLFPTINGAPHPGGGPHRG